MTSYVAFKDTSSSNTDDETQQFITAKEISRLHSSDRPNVSIQFKGLCFTGEKNKQILHGVDGYFAAGELTALMGPSGAGKSTLLNILAGYRTAASTGRVLINGEDRNLSLFRKYSCYVMQEDILYKNLTVLEYMMVSAELRLPSSQSLTEKKMVVLHVLKAMGLDHRLDNRTISLSGGQRKRLAVSLELINDPSILFLDEPTSGLDSTSAAAVVNMMKQMTANGRNIICTIHQPAASVLEMFDSVYLVCKGRCMFNGPVKDIVPYFERKGIRCPQFHNPADFMLEVASGDKGGEAQVKSLLDDWPQEQKTHYPMKIISNAQQQSSFPVARGEYIIDSRRQFKILFSRMVTETLRDKVMFRTRLVSNIFMGLLLGAIFFNVGVKCDSWVSTVGYIFFSTVFLMLGASLSTVTTFPLEKEIFIREHLNNWYSVRPFFIAKCLLDLPLNALFPWIYGTISYWMVGLPASGAVYWRIMFMYILHTEVAQSLSVLISCAAANVNQAVFLGPMASIPMMLFAGFLVSFPAIPAALRWLQWLSYIRYTLEGCVVSLFDFANPNTRFETNSNGIYINPVNYYYSSDEANTQDYGFHVGMLILFYILFRIKSYLILRKLAKKVY